MIGAVLLAAGESARFGRPKQLLPYRGRSLLRHAIECALGGGCEPVLVVLGARAAEVRSEVEATTARVVLNERWSDGIGGSIAAGVEALRTGWPDARGALLLACDQPRLTPELVRELLGHAQGSGRPIVACEYAGTLGIPAVFDRALHAELASLRGPGGAKGLIESRIDDVLRVPWPGGALDVDRPDDYERAIGRDPDPPPPAPDQGRSDSTQ